MRLGPFFSFIPFVPTLKRLKNAFLPPSYSFSVPEGDWRPRFLPDPDTARQWGKEGALLSRLIRSGVKVPPLACFGVGQIELWQSAENLRAELKPGLSEKTLETLRQMLCGGVSWTLRAWASPFSLHGSLPAFKFDSTDDAGLETALLEVRMNSQDKGQYAILISPELIPEQEGWITVGSNSDFGLDTHFAPKLSQELSEYRAAASKVGEAFKMHWIWDGDQLWIDRVGPID